MIITHSIPTTNNLMDRNRVRLSNNKNMNKFLLEAASCQYSMCNQLGQVHIFKVNNV